MSSETPQSHESKSAMPPWLGGEDVRSAFVTIQNRTPPEVFSFLRHVANFPRFMDGLVHVEELTGGEMRWVGRGDGEEWATEIVDDLAPTMFSWRSRGDTAFPQGGAFAMQAVPEGTEVHYRVAYLSVAGKAFGLAERLRGQDLAQKAEQDLLRLKALLEKSEAFAS